MKTKMFGLAAVVSLALLTGCPSGEGEQTGSTASPAGETTTTTTTTTTETTSTDAASPAGEQHAAAGVDAKAIFSQKCAGCHGATGGGGMGPALGDVEAKGDAHIKNVITNGSPTKGMPAFGPQLKAEEIDALVAYVKTL